MADESQKPIEQQANSTVEDGEQLDAESPESPVPQGHQLQCDSDEYNDQRIQQILDMKVPVIVKVADRNLKLKTIMRLHLGSIIQFEKDAYDQIELMVNNRTIGLGQPVKIGENFGLRLVQVGDLNDMIRSLGGQE